MNNGQTQASPQEFELDNLSVNTSSEDWSTPTPERDQRNLGSTAITEASQSSETPLSSEFAPFSESIRPAGEQSRNPELGQITPVMPPGYTEPEPAAGPDLAQGPASSGSLEPTHFSFAPHHAMAGDHLSPGAVSALQDRERQLSADGDIAAFVDFYDAASAEFQGKEAAWRVTPVSVFFTTIMIGVIRSYGNLGGHLNHGNRQHFTSRDYIWCSD